MSWLSTKRGWLRWFTRIAVGLVICLITFEVLLQGLALVLAMTGRQVDRSWLTEDRRILCLGDSNTFGLRLERHETYPSQLQASWNSKKLGPEIEVLNIGFPGTNSSRLRRDFPRMLETFQPSIAIVMIGVNDYWTRPVELDDSEAKTNARSFIERHSRTLKLYYMVRRAMDHRVLEVTRNPYAGVGFAGTGEARFGDAAFELGFAAAKPGEIFQPSERLRENLGEIAASAEAAGVELVLMTYAARFALYPVANKVIREFAEESRIQLIDLARVFAPRCPREDCPEYLFPDHHPTAAGYSLIAETIAAHLLSDLPAHQP